MRIGAVNIMKALCVQEQGDPVSPHVALIDLPKPTPAHGEVLVRTEASSLNHLDLWVGRGLPGIDTPFPRTGGSDGCGRVEAVGEGVEDNWMGQRVILNAAVEIPQIPDPDRTPAGRHLMMIGEHGPGTHAEYFTAPAANVLAVNDDLDPQIVAAYGLSHLTAFRMLTTKARLQPEQSILITGIGGGVALACLGIARHLGCRTIVTSRHQWKLDRAKELGADIGILDTGEDWSRSVREATSRRGVDVCADSIGAAVHLSCIKSLARGGRLVSCGCTSGPAPQTDLARIFWNQLEVLGSTMGDMDEFRMSVALLMKGLVQPVIDRVVPYSDGVSAFEHLESGEQFGKIVVDWT